MNIYLHTTATSNFYAFHCTRCQSKGFIWIKIGHNKTITCPNHCGQVFLQNEALGEKPELISLIKVEAKA